MDSCRRHFAIRPSNLSEITPVVLFAKYLLLPASPPHAGGEPPTGTRHRRCKPALDPVRVSSLAPLRPAPARLGHATTAVGPHRPSPRTALPAQMRGLEDGTACPAQTHGVGGSYGRRPAHAVSAPDGSLCSSRWPCSCPSDARGGGDRGRCRSRGTRVWASGEKRKAAALVVLRRDALHAVLVAASRQVV
ncbi:unnamed protein product [Urochloa humidicola]